MKTLQRPPQRVMLYPATRKVTRVTRKRGKTVNITSSMHENELEDTINRKKLIENEKEQENRFDKEKVQKIYIDGKFASY
nr:unnamed protein product [Callosobruchus chinensis]